MQPTRFTRGSNPGTKVCALCGKRTWVSKGNDVICEPCVERCEWENKHSDENHGPKNIDESCPICRNSEG